MEVLQSNLAVGHRDRAVTDELSEEAVACVVLAGLIEEAQDLGRVAIPIEGMALSVGSARRCRWCWWSRRRETTSFGREVRTSKPSTT